MKVPVQQIRIGIGLFSTIKEPLSPNLRKQAIFVHNAPYSLVIVMFTVLALYPNLYPAATVSAHVFSTVAAFLD